MAEYPPDFYAPFEIAPDGGSCAPGCHQGMVYRRGAAPLAAAGL